jgi:hypothetical protein
MDTAPADSLPPVTEEGPDHTSLPGGAPLGDMSGVEPPKSTPRPRAVRDVLNRGAAKLGTNKQRGSGVRALTTKDRAKIAGFYRGLAGAVMMFKPKAAKLIELSAEDAADKWMLWAEQNDATRKWLLSVLEGNAVVGIIAVHIPIILAFAPDRVWDQLPPIMHAMHPDVMIALKTSQQDGGE